MTDTTHQNIHIPAKPGITLLLRQPEVEDPKHAKLLGTTFATILVHDVNPDFVKSVFDELSKHYIRQIFDKTHEEQIVPITNNDTLRTQKLNRTMRKPS